MQHPGFEVPNDVDTTLKIDIRGDGGYIVAPPSIHATGRRYEWAIGCSIFDIDPAPCAPWMIDYLREVAAAAKSTSKFKSSTNARERLPCEPKNRD